MSEKRRRSHRGIDPGPQHVAGAMEQLLGRLGDAPTPHVLELVFTRWEEIAGAECAAHVQPLRVQGAKLIVGVEHPAWATRARMESAQILRRLNEQGETAITQIEVVVQRP
jgi:hypothetical protein